MSKQKLSNLKKMTLIAFLGGSKHEIHLNLIFKGFCDVLVVVLAKFSLKRHERKFLKTVYLLLENFFSIIKLDFLEKLMQGVIIIKGNAQFMFLYNPQKSCASRVCITFLQITQKILPKDIFHWLELITKILSFLQIFNIFLIFQKL